MKKRERETRENLPKTEILKPLNAHEAKRDGNEPHVKDRLCIYIMEVQHCWLLMVILACHSSKRPSYGPSASHTQPLAHCKCHRECECSLCPGVFHFFFLQVSVFSFVLNIPSLCRNCESPVLASPCTI